MNPSILFLFFLINSIICERVNYVNPIIRKDVPDPTIIKADNGYYYLYATGEGIYRSYDLVRWEYVRQVFEGKPRPSFIDVSSYWAPCITKQGDLYILYFALSVWDGIDTAGIGVATASSPEGPFDIQNGNGKLFQSGEVGVKNSIDPYYIEENGSKYIIWGSFYGIYGIELNSDGLSVKNYGNKFQLAGTYFEAAYIYIKEVDIIIYSGQLVLVVKVIEVLIRQLLEDQPVSLGHIIQKMEEECLIIHLMSFYLEIQLL